MTSKASEIVGYVAGVILAHNGVIDLTDQTKFSLIQNVNEPFSIAAPLFPMVQMTAPIARTMSQTRNIKRRSIDISIQVFFLPTALDGDPGSLAVSQYKQDVATDLEKIVDKIEANQISDTSGLIPDCWLENASSVIVEKSTLYSQPDELYPPYMATVSFQLFFDEEYA